MNLNKVIENRQKYPIFNGNSDMLFDAMLSSDYKDEFALVTYGLLKK